MIGFNNFTLQYFIYTQNPFDHSGVHPRRATVDNKYNFPPDPNDRHGLDAGFDPSTSALPLNGAQSQPLYGIVPELPPRIDRASKPGFPNDPMTPTSRTSAPPGTSLAPGGRNFGGITATKNGTDTADIQDEYAVAGARQHSMEKRVGGGGESSLDRKQNSLNRSSRTPNTATKPNNGSYDSVSSYDSMNTTQISMQNLRLGPNAPDDLKSVPSGK